VTPQSRGAGGSAAPARAGLVLVSLILVAAVANLNLSVANVALPDIDRVGSGDRVGMASGTADLQRDLGGALMTSIFGALLTAGYASAMGTAIAESGRHVTDSTQATLQLSYGSAEDLAKQHPHYASQITAAAQSSFLEGDQWAYLAALIAILIGMGLVFRFFPRKDAETALRAGYHASDAGAGRAPASGHVPLPERLRCPSRTCCSARTERSRSSRAGTSRGTSPSSTWSRPRRTR
jgi:hypothetical protein